MIVYQAQEPGELEDDSQVISAIRMSSYGDESLLRERVSVVFYKVR